MRMINGFIRVPVCASVGQSIGPRFSLSLGLRPKNFGDLRYMYCPSPPARNCGSRVSSLNPSTPDVPYLVFYPVGN